MGTLMQMMQSTDPASAKQQVENFVKANNVPQDQVQAVFSKASEIAKMLGLQ